jgi:hypothetical protein
MGPGRCSEGSTRPDGHPLPGVAYTPPALTASRREERSAASTCMGVREPVLRGRCPSRAPVKSGAAGWSRGRLSRGPRPRCGGPRPLRPVPAGVGAARGRPATPGRKSRRPTAVRWSSASSRTPSSSSSPVPGRRYPRHLSGFLRRFSSEGGVIAQRTGLPWGCVLPRRCHSLTPASCPSPTTGTALPFSAED